MSDRPTLDPSADRIPGLHHVTAIAGDPGENLAFYRDVLGLRLVKRTVNHDDPGTWHLYFGDAAASPGTVLTFFPHPGARPGRAGNGTVVATAMSVPAGSLGWWAERLADHGAAVDEPATRFGEAVLPFRDPHGMALELVEVGDGVGTPWDGGPVGAERAIRGFHSVTASLADPEPTVAFLTDELGFEPTAEAGGRVRYAGSDAAPGAWLDILARPDGSPGRVSAGVVHHVAWRAGTPEEQAAWRERVVARGLDPSPVIERHYFRSFYFREPGGVLFEFATDGPGMDRDEPLDALGERLVLPPWLEERRAEIEARLPPLEA